jgi:Ca2+-binding EF-hand superfamily protein
MADQQPASSEGNSNGTKSEQGKAQTAVKGRTVTDEELRQVFNLFDLDRKGILSNEELLLALKALGLPGVSKLSLGDASETIRQAKYRLANNEGDPAKFSGDAVDIRELREVVEAMIPESKSNAEVEAAYRQWDIRGKNALALDDLQRVYLKVEGKGSAEDLSADEKAKLSKLLVSADRRGRGISLEDWKHIMARY